MYIDESLTKKNLVESFSLGKRGEQEIRKYHAAHKAIGTNNMVNIDELYKIIFVMTFILLLFFCFFYTIPHHTIH